MFNEVHLWKGERSVDPHRNICKFADYLGTAQQIKSHVSKLTCIRMYTKPVPQLPPPLDFLMYVDVVLSK